MAAEWFTLYQLSAGLGSNPVLRCEGEGSVSLLIVNGGYSFIDDRIFVLAFFFFFLYICLRL